MLRHFKSSTLLCRTSFKEMRPVVQKEFAVTDWLGFLKQQAVVLVKAGNLYL